MDRAITVLNEYFGHTAFRDGQRELVDCLLSGRDAFGIMPTGAGKSICYQVPALLMEGVTIIVSPLISLMKDQVHALLQAGVRAAFINSSLTPAQTAKALQNAAAGMYRLIYVAPERLLTAGFLNVCQTVPISMVAVDEAHCVSQWGQDFRPGYLKIAAFLDELPRRPVVAAFTATATREVREDVVRLLTLRDPLIRTTGFDRLNLFFAVEHPASKTTRLLELLSERQEKSGIVYCATRKAVDEVWALLAERGYPATRYHAGLPEAERRQNQEDFVYDRKPVMVATNAFGMGIDKSNVSFVIHYQMPKNLESYYQEAGRAGRDGAEADCILLYSPQDVRVNRFLIERAQENPELSADEQQLAYQRDLERLKQMTFYSTTQDCLRGYILNYFADRAPAYCGKCSNCLQQVEAEDVTEAAQKLLACVSETGMRFGRKMIWEILRGGESERLLRLGLDRHASYGMLAGWSEPQLRTLTDLLEEQGYLTTEQTAYPILKWTARSETLSRGEVSLRMRMVTAGRAKAKKATLSDVNPALLEALRKRRLELARKGGVPAYIVFTDATLLDMCRKHPRTPEAFLAVSGVGKEKLARYGQAFLEVLQEF